MRVTTFGSSSVAISEREQDLLAREVEAGEGVGDSVQEIAVPITFGQR